MKKLISLILATVMVLSLIPAAFAADASGFEVSFLNADISTDGNRYLIGTGATNSSDKGVRWAFGKTTTDNFEVPTFNPDADNVEKNALALKFTCQTAGTYIPTLNYDSTYNKKGAIAEVHIVKADGFNLTDFVKAADSSTRVGKIDFFEGASAALSEVSLSAGEYYLILIAIGENSGRKNWSAESNGTTYYYAAQRLQSLSFAPASESLNVNDALTYKFHAAAYNLSEKSVGDTALEENHLGFVGVDSVSANRSTKGWLVHTGTEANTAYARVRHDVGTTGGLSYDFINPEVSQPWIFIARSSLSNRYANTNNLYINAAKADVSAGKAYITFKIKVASPGKYDVKLDGVDVSSGVTQGGAAKIYISRNNEKDGLIGAYNFFGDVKEEKIGTFEADAAGDYYFTLDLVDSTDAETAASANNSSFTHYCAGLKSLTLVYTGENDAAAAITAQKEAQQNPEKNEAVASGETEASTASAVSTFYACIGGENGTLDISPDENGAYTAPDAIDEYSFLYWTKGLQNYESKRIVSVNKQISYKPEIGGNYLIAVYGKTDGTAQTAKYFNANGQLLSDANAETVPSMPGYSDFKGWVDCGNNIYMAEYETEEAYTVTVNCDGALKETKAPGYGDEVTVTAPSRASDGYRLFAYWEKTDAKGNTEIVSFDKAYTFYAFEGCAVNAVYNEYEPLAKSLSKIILTNIGGTNYMAEFIGFGDAAEKGIMVGSNKIAMTTDKSQFTVDAEKASETVKGYAVDSDGKVYYSGN